MKSKPPSKMMLDICYYIQENYRLQLDLNTLAQMAHMSPSHFQKEFKKNIGLTAKEFQESCRLKSFKSKLKKGKDVTSCIYDVGYQSSSRIYEKINSKMGMTPKSYQRGGKGMTISYATADTILGVIIIAATQRGICFLQFDKHKTTLINNLKQEFPKANISKMPNANINAFNDWVLLINQYLNGEKIQLKLPLDLNGTIFQKQVWTYLQSIPTGKTISYSDLAKKMKQPRSVRAIASACARNKIAILIPCHRVIRNNGDLAGYRWGLERKEQLLKIEKNSTA